MIRSVPGAVARLFFCFWEIVHVMRHSDKQRLLFHAVNRFMNNDARESMEMAAMMADSPLAGAEKPAMAGRRRR